MEEKVIKIPLKKIKRFSKNKRASKAIYEIRERLSKHLDTDIDQIYIDNSLNEEIWKRGIKKPPSHIRVLARRFEDGVVEAELAEQ
ncbi:50S ribosomal protein L31e [Methanonatronarchaeum sp. AMET-Sl]|uniref:50S ribosomal protein L31e n=1 Tax=Methanonatronarchaeum sp. AMET-Sl TaxID=3037654 RepID=UPI00244DBE2B|nr:50S ribosomal protein L31e [Methanonatronarchaeum sp. AMET-Sl]WGI16768.1 50S ribosomal protein L31e [Methanonatronarchaeum sp. AMET-Sl]